MGNYFFKYYYNFENNKKQTLDQILELSMTQNNLEDFFILDYNSISTFKSKTDNHNIIQTKNNNNNNIFQSKSDNNNIIQSKTNYSDLLNTTLSEQNMDNLNSINENKSNIVLTDVSSLDISNTLSEWNTLLDLSKTVI